MGATERYDVRRPEYEWFAARVARARKENGLTQKDLGERLGIPTRTITNWERACRYPRADEVRKLAEALGKPPSYFVDDEMSKQIEEEALALTVRFLQRLMHGEELAAAIDAETGSPDLLDRDRRRQFAATSGGLRRWIESQAPRAWELLDEEAQQELLAALLRDQAASPDGG